LFIFSLQGTCALQPRKGKEIGATNSWKANAVADLSDIADADAGIIICVIFAEFRCVGLLCFCVLLSS